MTENNSNEVTSTLGADNSLYSEHLSASLLDHKSSQEETLTNKSNSENTSEKGEKGEKGKKGKKSKSKKEWEAKTGEEKFDYYKDQIWKGFQIAVIAAGALMVFGPLGILMAGAFLFVKNGHKLFFNDNKSNQEGNEENESSSKENNLSQLIKELKALISEIPELFNEIRNPTKPLVENPTSIDPSQNINLEGFVNPTNQDQTPTSGLQNSRNELTSSQQKEREGNPVKRRISSNSP